MSALGSLVLYCAWASGLVAAFFTIRSMEEMVSPVGPVRRVPIALAGVVVGSLWLPWVSGPAGERTLSGWFALDAATVIAVVLLATGIAALAALPDRGGEKRDLLSLSLALCLCGIVAGNWLIGAGGGWGNHLKWGAAITLAAAAALAIVEAAHFRAGAPTEIDDAVDLTGELSRLNDSRYF